MKKGAGNAEVALRLEGGSTLTSMVSEGTLMELAMGKGRKGSERAPGAEGAEAFAVFKASNVILGVAR